MQSASCIQYLAAAFRQWHAERGELEQRLWKKPMELTKTQDIHQQELHWSDVPCVLVSFVLLDVYMSAAQHSSSSALHCCGTRTLCVVFVRSQKDAEQPA